MRSDHANQIRVGWDVFGAAGEKIGRVADASKNYFVIESSQYLTTDLFLPMSAIVAMTDGRVELSLTREQIEAGNFTFPIGDASADRHSAPTSESSSGHGTSDAASPFTTARS